MLKTLTPEQYEDLQSHLSHLRDKLSTISSSSCVLGLAVGEVKVVTRLSNDPISHYTSLIEKAFQDADAIVCEIREVLNSLPEN